MSQNLPLMTDLMRLVVNALPADTSGLPAGVAALVDSLRQLKQDGLEVNVGVVVSAEKDTSITRTAVEDGNPRRRIVPRNP